MNRPLKNQRIQQVGSISSGNPSIARLQTNSPLRKLRNNVNLTQEQLAHKMGIAVSTVRRWEKGLAEPTMTLDQTKKSRFEWEASHSKAD
jgi:DNA-binding transcriptional regulator YiaG